MTNFLWILDLGDSGPNRIGESGIDTHGQRCQELPAVIGD